MQPASHRSPLSPTSAMRQKQARGKAAKAGFVSEQLRATDPDEVAIKQAKKRLEEMQVRRQRIAVDVERRNQAMMDRDEVARRRYAELTKDEISEAEAAEIAQKQLFEEQRTRLEAEEEALRGLLIEEDQLKRKLLSNSDHLTLIGIAVSRLYAESRRRQWEEEARSEAARNQQRMDVRARESFLAAYEEDRRQLVRDEQSRFRAMAAECQQKIADVQKRQAERERLEAAAAARHAQETAAAAERAADDEVAAMEAALEARAAAISGKFTTALAKPPPEAPPAGDAPSPEAVRAMVERLEQEAAAEAAAEIAAEAAAPPLPGDAPTGSAAHRRASLGLETCESRTMPLECSPRPVDVTPRPGSVPARRFPSAGSDRRIGSPALAETDEAHRILSSPLVANTDSSVASRPTTAGVSTAAPTPAMQQQQQRTSEAGGRRRMQLFEDTMTLTPPFGRHAFDEED
uniref:Uncharacterized protein n=1 Tax=Neobodo designis TaxID=312471 RepID=A0A7S1LR91_NEODS|mmetsp:Transcript_26617/g.82324  ORF Transcript_26617/g.82324 Transcript_26617/m.82324 type:complete len:461 (+) Transcript_26617:47-1429(+)